MKKTVVIILIILVIVLGGIAISNNDSNMTALAPVIETPAVQGNTPAPTTGSQPNTDRVRGPERATIAIGESGIVAGTTIKITGLIGDSRCPADVQCIQAGSVGIRTTLTRGTATTSHDFTSNGSAFVFEGYSLVIVNVTPARTQAGAAIKPSEYRITFEVTPTAKGDNI